MGLQQGLLSNPLWIKDEAQSVLFWCRKVKLSRGDILLCGEEYGRVRAMFDEQGNQVESAGPSLPVVVLGLSGTVNAGDEAIVVESERKAREVAESPQR